MANDGVFLLEAAYPVAKHFMLLIANVIGALVQIARVRANGEKGQRRLRNKGN
jgi:hypothetical protein